MGRTLPWSDMVEYVRGERILGCWGLKVVVLGVNREETEKGVDNRRGAVSGIKREEERRRRAIKGI